MPNFKSFLGFLVSMFLLCGVDAWAADYSSMVNCIEVGADTLVKLDILPSWRSLSNYRVVVAILVAGKPMQVRNRLFGVCNPGWVTGRMALFLFP